MTWNSNLTDIQYRLVELYPDEMDIKRICITSGINVSTLQLQGTAINQWFSILNTIEVEKINEIAAIVERDRGQKDDKLETLIRFLIPKEKVVADAPEFKLNILRHDFPRPKSYFVGREEELKILNEAYESSPFIFIEGAGGIGKTQFIAKFIESLPQKDRIVWFDCTPTSQPDDVILGAGFDELLKGKEKTEREKFSAFKDKVQEFDLAVFLDNYQEVENNPNFKSLLAFFNEYLTKGHLIVIGRDNIVSPNLQPKRIHLKGLGDKSVEHARKLLEHVYSESKNISDETLIRICYELKGYPLAIDLAVYLLSEGESEENILQAAVNQAMAEDSGNEKISERLLNTIFTRTDASQEEKEFLKLISVFRGKVDKEAAQAVMTSEYYQTAWRKLVKRNLLTVEDGYFELHPLIREFSYKELENKKEVHTKAADYYISIRTEKLDIDLEEKLFYHLSQANQWSKIAEIITNFGRQFILNGYLDRLQNMITRTRNQGEAQPLFDILEGDIAEIKGDWTKATELFHKAMNSTIDDVQIEGIVKSGEMHFRKSQPQEAKNLFEIGIQESEKKEVLPLQARALNDIGLVYAFWGENYLSLEYLSQALSIREKEGSLEDVAISLTNIGSVKDDLGEKKEALKFYERSLEIQEEIGNKLGVAHSLLNVGSVKSALGDKKEALKLYKKGLEIQKEIGNKSGIASSLNSIGSVKRALRDKREALKLYEKSFEIQKEIGSKFGIAVSLNNIGLVKSDLGEYKEALKFFERSLEIREEIGDKSGVASSLNNIGGMKNELGEYKEALKFFERSLEIREEIGDKSGVANSLQNIGSCLLKNNKELEKSCLFLLKSIALYKQIGMPDYFHPLNWLKEMKQKTDIENFKRYVGNAFNQLDEELKPFIKLDEILGLPIKVEKKVGRNDPCPCGSGKKYKYCHGSHT